MLVDCSSSSQNTQHSYVTVDEGDEEGRPLGRCLENICEESDVELQQRQCVPTPEFFGNFFS